jgi:hypothetical protein
MGFYPAPLGLLQAQTIMPGDDLLFQRLSVSTIGAVRFHGRVRDGIGWGTDAMVTKQYCLRLFAKGGFLDAVVFKDAMVRLEQSPLPSHRSCACPELIPSRIPFRAGLIMTVQVLKHDQSY